MFSNNLTFIIALKSYDFIVNINDPRSCCLGLYNDIIFSRYALFRWKFSPCYRSINSVIITAFIVVAHNFTIPYQHFNRDAVDRKSEMQGLQKLKCATCGTMFMAETETTTCPSCSEQSHSHHEHGAGGCGCGH